VAQEPIDSPKKTGPAVTSAGITADALAGFHSTVSRLSSSQVVILADRAGVPRRLAAKARAGRLIGAEAYLKLCSALGLDPTTGLVKVTTTSPQARCQWWLVGSVVFFRRTQKRQGIRAAAREIGISTATLSRAENGRPVAIDSLLHLAAYVQLPPDVLVGFCVTDKAVTAPVARETPAGSACVDGGQHPTPIEPREVSLQDSHSQGVSTASARRTTRAA